MFAEKSGGARSFQRTLVQIRCPRQSPEYTVHELSACQHCVLRIRQCAGTLDRQRMYTRSPMSSHSPLQNRACDYTIANAMNGERTRKLKQRQLCRILERSVQFRRNCEYDGLQIAVACGPAITHAHASQQCAWAQHRIATAGSQCCFGLDLPRSKSSLQCTVWTGWVPIDNDKFDDRLGCVCEPRNGVDKIPSSLYLKRSERTNAAR